MCNPQSSVAPSLLDFPRHQAALAYELYDFRFDGMYVWQVCVGFLSYSSKTPLEYVLIFSVRGIPAISFGRSFGLPCCFGLDFGN
jgi:hypothetical protein